jgi:hypothetical protein
MIQSHSLRGFIGCFIIIKEYFQRFTKLLTNLTVLVNFKEFRGKFG